MSFLKQIIREKREELKEIEGNLDKLSLSCSSLQKAFNRDVLAFLREEKEAKGAALFAEIKRKSPSSGVLDASIKADERAREFENAGASAVSVLTDEKWFGGSLKDLLEVSTGINLPVLMKDFVVDRLQLKAAAFCGASIVLLIAEVLGKEIEEFVEFSFDLGLEPLVEVRSENDFYQAVKSGARLIGINARDLNTLEIDRSIFTRFGRLKKERGLKDVFLIAESGFLEAKEVIEVLEDGFDGFLIGTRLSLPDGPEFLRDLLAKTRKMKEVELHGR